MARSVWKGPFVDGYLFEEGRDRRALPAATRVIKHLVAAFDDHAAVRRV